ncbi:MAG TPA: hypothetical protein DDW83_04905 [Peptococcaceae bacterium]|nr:hypothetical protein [Peptococcaceae bacterium]
MEKEVQDVERRLLAPLRNHVFFSLYELNRALLSNLAEWNNRPFQKLDGCRRSLFESLDKPALKPLPNTAYEFARWKKLRVNIDYHVEIDHNFYSVPYQLVHKQIEARITATTVEIFHRGQRVASHPLRRHGKGHFSTQSCHLAPAHLKHKEWSP